MTDWLILLPFANPAGDTLAVINSLPTEHRSADRLGPVITALGIAPGRDAEKVLFQLAKACPKLYDDRTWHDAVERRDTLTAALSLADLTASGVFEGNGSAIWDMTRRLGVLMDDYPEVRARVYQLRIPVSVIVGQIAHGATVAQVLADFPDLEEQDVRQALQYAAWLTTEEVRPVRTSA